MSETATLPIRAKEAAEIIGVTESDLYALVRAGKIPGAYRVGRSVRFVRESLLEFRANGGTPSRKQSA